MSQTVTVEPSSSHPPSSVIPIPTLPSANRSSDSVSEPSVDETSEEAYAPVEGPMALLELVGGRWPVENQGTAARLQMSLKAGGAALVLAAMYGGIVGSTDVALSVANLWKIPGVIALSSITALPAALLAFKLTGGRRGASDLIASTAAGNFSAMLVLAALSPLVALYYHTSTSFGAILAIGASILALFVGVGSGIRLAYRSRPTLRASSRMTLPMLVLVSVQLLAMFQFLHLASPILPEMTVFDMGVDGVWK